METIYNFIDGELTRPTTGRYLEKVEPATGTSCCEVPDSSEADIDAAVDAAQRAAPAWGALPPEARASLLSNLASIIDRELERLALAESVDTGKPLALAKHVDIPRAAANFRFFAAAATQFASECHLGETLNITLREPLGTVGCITPWNLPLYLLTWKIAPALAAGNTVVAKPSELTPTTAYLLSHLSREAGLPPGVLNIVHGTGESTGAALCAHPDVAALSFTGGTDTGSAIAHATAHRFKKISLEMGGKNAALIFGDCNLEEALRTTLRSAFSNQGQICLCTSRIYVQRPLYAQFIERLVEAANRLVVGDPFDEATDQGALISREHRERVVQSLELASAQGGELLCGGTRVRLDGRCAGGFFLRPALVSHTNLHAPVNQEEIFGPVATVAPFDTEEEAIELANGTRFGLASVVWTSDLARAHRVARGVKSGLVWINSWMARDLRTPFGGMKHSGVGREGGFEALRFFTEPKNICFGT